jgi:hypothetical protein
MVPGYNSNYAVHFGTTTAVGAMDAGGDWGGFLMFYFPFQNAMPVCVSPANYTGIRFWARGMSGANTMGVSLGTVETVPVSDGGMCNNSADAAACAYPTAKMNVPMAWSQIQLPWSSFTGGIATSGCASAPGSGILRIVIQPFESYPAPNYKVSPAPYGLDVDNVEFY